MGQGSVHRRRASDRHHLRRVRLRHLRCTDSVGKALADEHFSVVLGAAVAGQSQVFVCDAGLGGAVHDGRNVAAAGGVGLLLLQP